MIAEIRRRFLALPRAARWRWGSLAPLGLASAALEALAGALVFALLAVLLSPPGAAPAGVLHSWLASLGGPASSSNAIALAAAAAAAHIGKTLLGALTAWWRARMAAYDSAALSSGLFRHYLEAPWTFHLQRSSPALMEVLRGSARPFFEVFEAAALVATELAVIAALAVVAILVAPLAVTVGALVLMALVAAAARLTRESQEQGGARSLELGTALYRHIQYGLGAGKELRLLGRGEHVAAAFERDARASAGLEATRAAADAVPRLALETAFVAGLLALVAFGSMTGSVAAVIPLASLYAYAGFRVVPAAHRIALQMNNLRWSLAASTTVTAEVLNTAALAAGEPPQDRAAARPGSDEVPATDLTLCRELRAVGVSFRYPGSDRDVLSGLDLAIRAGESVAIVGVTGAGKTTLVDVLVGLLTPTAGRVCVDGEPLAGREAAFQSRVGYVPQQPFMLDDTVRRNIALGLDDADIDAAAIDRAVGLARLDGVVARLPDGLDTPIGENGCQLAGGERQRIAIARALYRDPPLVVFDEAMSSLDPGTERDIASAIDRLRGTRTLVVVAHRMTTVERCDRVLLLDRGRIRADGTYRELLAGSELFRALAAAGRDAPSNSLLTAGESR